MKNRAGGGFHDVLVHGVAIWATVNVRTQTAWCTECGAAPRWCPQRLGCQRWGSQGPWLPGRVWVVRKTPLSPGAEQPAGVQRCQAHSRVGGLGHSGSAGGGRSGVVRCWMGRPRSSSVCWRRRWWWPGHRGRCSTEGRSGSWTWSGGGAQSSGVLMSSLSQCWYTYSPRRQLIFLDYVVPFQFIVISIKSSNYLSLYYPYTCALPHCFVAKLGLLTIAVCHCREGFIPSFKGTELSSPNHCTALLVGLYVNYIPFFTMFLPF